MSKEQKNRIRKYRRKLVKDLDLKYLDDNFIHYGLFTEDTIEEIKLKPSRRERIHEILNKLLREGPEAFESFVLSIKETYPWLASILTEPDKITCPIQKQVDSTVHEHFGNSRKLCEEDKKEIRHFLYTILLTNSEKSEHPQSIETEAITAHEQVDSFVHRHFGNSRRLSEKDKQDVRDRLCTILSNKQRENLDNCNHKMETRKRKYSTGSEEHKIGDTVNHTCVNNHLKTELEKQIKTEITKRIFKILPPESQEVSQSHDASMGCSIENLVQTIAELVNKNESAKQLVSEMEAKYEKLQNEVKDILCILEKENCGTPNSLRQAFEQYKTERHSEFMKIKEEHADVKEKLANVESKRYDLEKKLKATANELAATKQKLKETEQELSLSHKLGTKIDSLDTTNADLKATIVDLKASNADQKATIADLKASNADLKATFTQLYDKKDSMFNRHRPGTRQSLPPLTQRQSTGLADRNHLTVPKLKASTGTSCENGKSRQFTLRTNSILEQDISTLKATTRKTPWL